MVGAWLRLFVVPGCFRPPSSDPRSQHPIAVRGEFYSPRIAEIVEKLKSNPRVAKLESEVEASRVTWSELSTTSVIGDALAAENSRVFQSLQEQWPGGFFKEWKEGEWEVGEKIAEGGQAELFALRRLTRSGGDFDIYPQVVKMFKEGSSLQDLQRLLPHNMLADDLTLRGGFFLGGFHCILIHGATMVNGRFAIRMARQWGDLRKLVDARMIHNHMRSSPFTGEVSTRCMRQIADGMKALHRSGITHRDLKAANVLVGGDYEFYPIKDHFGIFVADYECSVGVVGTGFWRAPEILLAVKNRNVTPELFTKAADVYGYAMTCYEVLTGRMPFELEGFRSTEYDRVIDGYRPSLPSQTPQWMKTLLDRCWHADPLERPTFEEIVDVIKEEMKRTKEENKSTVAENRV